MIERWQDVDDVVVDTATGDLEAGRDVVPLLVAFAGDELLLCADVRPFPRGAYADPIIELLALTAPLGADRLAFAASGRLTSLEDPIPPVTEEVDLRQRALVVEYADGSDGVVRQRSVIHPFDVDGAHVAWRPPLQQDNGQGWIRDVLGWAVAVRAQLAAEASVDDVRDQAQRCAALGHGLYLGAGTAVRLGLSDATRL